MNNNKKLSTKWQDDTALQRFTLIAPIGRTVEISYDPAAPEVITVYHSGTEPFQATPLTIGAYCDQKPPLASSMESIEPETSRFLDALEI